MIKAKSTTALSSLEDDKFNSLDGVSQLLNLNSALGGAQLSKKNTLYYNLRWDFISNDRNLLSQVYVEHGIVQTLVDQPVDDAFRSGYKIITGQLSPEEIDKLYGYMKKNYVIAELMQAIKWSRLYGGAAVMIVTNQNPATPFTIESIKDSSKLLFKSVDMWELYTSGHIVGEGYHMDDKAPEFYNYYGVRVHSSRVLRIEGKQAPSLVRPRLRGWGMSELERLVRSLNQYLKNQDVVFELLDEAKIDVFKIKGFNTSLLTNSGSASVATRIQNANMIKNYNNALTMDIADEYEQKSIAFTGLAEMLVQIRQGIAADLKMPVTKLFGISSAGFSSGEDEIENYNSMVEGEIRNKVENHVVELLKICSQKLFGLIPEDLEIEFESLRIMSSKDEEEVKTSEFNRVMAAYSSGLIDDLEAKESLNKEALLPIEINDAQPANPPVGADFTIKKPTNFDAKDGA